MILRTPTCALALVLTGLICGCSDGTDGTDGMPVPPVMVDGHDNHEGHDHGGAGHPESLGEALHQLTELRDTVRDAFAAGDLEAAHGPLHSVGHLIDEVSELAAEAGIAEEAVAAIDSNCEILMDSFGEVDKKMHSEDEGSDYSEVSEKIDAALAAIVKSAGAAGEHESHDEHGDHHEHAEGHHDDHGHDEHEGHDKDAGHEEEHGDHDDHDHKGHDKDGEHKDEK